MGGHAHPWRVVFRSTVVIALPDWEIFTLDGECRGEIIPEERGSGGFGYDPSFLVEGQGRTMAELTRIVT
ncbi:MAG: non-canonical purine NTP pyrophosphatase [Leptolinea sp.]